MALAKAHQCLVRPGVLHHHGHVNHARLELEALDVFHAQLGRTLGGLAADYRTQAVQAGETLSEAGLREFFQTARQFYRQELWSAYGDEVVFEIALQAAQGAAKTLYGVLMGNMGEEFGLALLMWLPAL
jgi:hypothetical protein